MQKTCPICGKVFETSNAQKKYCSQDCAYEANIIRTNKYNKEHRKTETERVCPVCGKIFNAKGRKKYCSAACRRQSTLKQAEITKKCAICGKTFVTRCHQRKYCSDECILIARKKRDQELREEKRKNQPVISPNDMRNCKHKDCKYRGSIDHQTCCEYILVTGHKRGCTIADCDKYEKGRRRRVRKQIMIKEGEKYA